MNKMYNYNNTYNKNKSGYKNNKFNSATSDEDKYVEYFKVKIINIDERNYDLFIDKEKGYAKLLKDNGMTTSQIRNIYSDIIRTKDVMELKRLRPKFAYIAGRNKKAVGKFMDLLDYVVKSMDKEKGYEQVKNFKDFLEAIVAYRKYFGDKN